MRLTTIFIGTGMLPVIRAVNKAMAMCSEVASSLPGDDALYVDHELREPFQPHDFDPVFFRIAREHHVGILVDGKQAVFTKAKQTFTAPESRLVQ